jgi:hypothetical protein
MAGMASPDPHTRRGKAVWRARWWWTRYVGYIGYVIGFTLIILAFYVNGQNRQAARRELCADVSRTRTAMVSVVNNALRGSRPSADLDEFIRQSNADLHEPSKICNFDDVPQVRRLPPLRIVIVAVAIAAVVWLGSEIRTNREAAERRSEVARRIACHTQEGFQRYASGEFKLTAECYKALGLPRP